MRWISNAALDFEREGFDGGRRGEIIEFPQPDERRRERRQPLLGLVIVLGTSSAFWGTLLWMILG